MRLYDTLIIGSGYSSAGYALTHKNSIIIEENQCVDVGFYLPLRSFVHTQYNPVTELGKRLNETFEKYNLFSDGYMCTNSFESAFCKFLSKEDIEILIKCRIVEMNKQEDGIYKVVICSNEGLSTIYAKNIIDTTVSVATSEKYMTVLFVAENFDDAKTALLKVFQSAVFSKAFYDKRYAMHIPCGETDDVNEMLCFIHDKWLLSGTDAKVLYVPPVFYPLNFKPNKNDFQNDFCFSNPIAAFEAGISFAGGIE